MNRFLGLIGALGAGAALMYILDPSRGKRRRALVRDKAVGLSNDAREAIGGKARHLANKAKGMVHEAKETLKGSERPESRGASAG